jgi:hypothetical protein
MDQWYELRVAGSAGTTSGEEAGIKEGIAVAEGGRLCALAAGRARKFETREQALEYLGKIKVSGDYRFEVVRCGAGTGAGNAATPLDGQSSPRSSSAIPSE